MSSKNIYRYYVYAYLRSKDSSTAKAGTPYYIGKGCRDRAYRYHKHINLPADKSLIVFLETNLSEVGALALERRMIRWHGRKIDNSGILLNISDGGQSSSGTVPWNKDLTHSDETKNKISKTKTGVSLGSYYNNGIRNIVLKDTDSIPPGYVKGKLLSLKQLEQLERIRVSAHSPESRKKANNTMKSKNRPADFVHGNTGKIGKTMWIKNIELNTSQQVKFSNELPEGWVKGRIR